MDVKWRRRLTGWRKHLYSSVSYKCMSTEIPLQADLIKMCCYAALFFYNLFRIILYLCYICNLTKTIWFFPKGSNIWQWRRFLRTYHKKPSGDCCPLWSFLDLQSKYWDCLIFYVKRYISKTNSFIEMTERLEF